MISVSVETRNDSHYVFGNIKTTAQCVGERLVLRFKSGELVRRCTPDESIAFIALVDNLIDCAPVEEVCHFQNWLSGRLLERHTGLVEMYFWESPGNATLRMYNSELDDIKLLLAVELGGDELTRRLARFKGFDICRQLCREGPS